MPWFLAAEMGTTGTPSMVSSRLTSTEPPLAATSSIMLRAMTIGTSSSISCSVR